MNSIEKATSNTVEEAIQNRLVKKHFFNFNRKTIFLLGFGAVVCLSIFLFWYSSDKTEYNSDKIFGFMGKSEMVDALPIYSTDLISIQSSLGIFQRKDTLMVVMDKKSGEDISVGYHFEPDYVSFIGIRENNLNTSSVQKVEGKASVTIPDSSKVFMMFQVLKPASTMDLQIRDVTRQIFRYKFTVGQKSK